MIKYLLVGRHANGCVNSFMKSKFIAEIKKPELTNISVEYYREQLEKTKSKLNDNMEIHTIDFVQSALALKVDDNKLVPYQHTELKELAQNIIDESSTPSKELAFVNERCNATMYIEKDMGEVKRMARFGFMQQIRATQKQIEEWQEFKERQAESLQSLAYVNIQERKQINDLMALANDKTDKLLIELNAFSRMQIIYSQWVKELKATNGEQFDVVHDEIPFSTMIDLKERIQSIEFC